MFKKCHTDNELRSRIGSQGTLPLTKKEAIKRAKAKIELVGGRWGVAYVDGIYFEAHEKYFENYKIKPVWMAKNFWGWLRRDH
jgi:hypothetical protein